MRITYRRFVAHHLIIRFMRPPSSPMQAITRLTYSSTSRAELVEITARRLTSLYYHDAVPLSNTPY